MATILEQYWRFIIRNDEMVSTYSVEFTVGMIWGMLVDREYSEDSCRKVIRDFVKENGITNWSEE